MPQTEPQRETVEQLAEEFVARYRSGERPSIAEYVQRHPDREDEIREVLEAAVMIERLAPASAAGSIPHSEGVTGADGGELDQLGDFRIIREVGRGGMGVVYEAEQVSLGRRVALKVLPRQVLLDSKHAKRFEREARAAAKLHHTNIVPVFGVGQQDGLHYYVMQFIHGLGLDEVLMELQRLRDEGPGSRVQGQEVAVGVQASACARQPEGWTPTRNDVSAAAVANSLLSGHFERTVVVDSDAEGTDQPFSPSLHPRPSALDPTTAVGRLSDTFPLPGQSEHSSKAHTRSVYWQSVARIGVQAAEALQYAHDQGVIHRDVKPGNLLLDTRGCVWVTDFGLAKATDQQDLTHTGDVLGTLRYMAPEQFDGKADARSDVFSLGLTLYELLALKPAFDETERHKLIKQVTTGAPPRLRTLDPHIPRDLETIVHKAIDRDPSHRYQTAGELAADLQRYLGDEPIHARRPPALLRLAKWSRRHRAAVATAVVGLLALITLAAGAAGWVAHDRAARQARIGEEIERNLGEVAELMLQDRWADARSMVQRSETLVATADVDANIHSRVAQVLDDLRLEQELEDARSLKYTWTDTGFDFGGSDRAYAEAFRAHDVQIDGLPPQQAADRLRSRREIVMPILVALDEWAHSRRQLANDDEADWMRLISVAQQLDQDPQRQRLRVLWSHDVTDDVKTELMELARNENPVPAARPTIILLVRVLQHAELGSEAQTVLRAAQRRNVADFWLNVALAQLLENEHDHEQAIRFFSMCVSLRPDNSAAWNSLGAALANNNEFDEAALAFLTAIDRNPTQLPANKNLARFYGTRDRRDDAIQVLRPLLQIHPNDPEIYNLLAVNLDRLGRTGEAIEVLRSGIDADATYASNHESLGDLLGKTGRYQEAIAECRLAVQLDPDDGGVRATLAEVLARYAESLANSGQPEKAIEIRDEAIALNQEAIAQCRLAVQLDPGGMGPRVTLARALTHYADSLAISGQLEKAIEIHHEAIALDPESDSAYFYLGNALRLKGDRDGAVDAYRTAIDRSAGKNVEAWENLGFVQNQNGQFDEAIATYKTAIGLNPRSAMAHNGLGTALLSKREVDEAMDAFNRAIEIDEAFGQPYANLAYIFSNTGQLDRAIEYARKAIDRNCPAYANLAAALYKSRRFAEAVEAARTAVECNPQDIHAYQNLSSSLSAIGEYDESIEVLRTAIDKHEGNYLLHYSLGNALDSTGRVGEAVQAYRKSIQCNANFMPAHCNLAFTLMELEMWDEQEVLRHARLVTEHAEGDPNAWRYWRCLTLATFAAGEWEESLAAIEQKGRILPYDLVDKLHLAMTHFHLGHRAEAEDWFDQGSSELDAIAEPDAWLLQLHSQAEALLKTPEEQMPE